MATTGIFIASMAIAALVLMIPTRARNDARAASHPRVAQFIALTAGASAILQAVL